VESWIDSYEKYGSIRRHRFDQESPIQ